MKKTINLLSLLLLISVASSQANVFGRFAQRARQRVGKMYDRVPADTLRKAVRVADVAFVGLVTYSCGKTIFGALAYIKKMDKDLEHLDETLESLNKEKKKISESAGAAQEATQNPESSESEFKKRVAELREYAITSGLYDADTYDNLEQWMKFHERVQCFAEHVRAERKAGKEVVWRDCDAERTSLFPFEAGVAAKKRMLEEREKAGPVEPLKFTRTKMTTNGFKVCLPENYLRENDPLIQLWRQAHKDADRLRATVKATIEATAEAFKPKEQKNEAPSTDAAAQPTEATCTGDRFVVGRHAIDTELLAAEPVFDLGALGKRVEEINKKPEYQ